MSAILGRNDSLPLGDADVMSLVRRVVLDITFQQVIRHLMNTLSSAVDRGITVMLGITNALLVSSPRPSPSGLEHHPPVLVHAQHGTRPVLNPGGLDVIVPAERLEKLSMIVDRDFATSETLDAGAVGGSEEGSQTVARRDGRGQGWY